MKGIALLNDTEPLLNPAIREKQSVGEPNGSFAGIINQAINEVKQAQVEADHAIQELATGNEKDIHQTMIALEKAEVYRV
jgi:flagellar hook-basal body complex protein FliE